ncbi:DUF1515 domain-containing protein [Shinella sp. CPCC 101442]|jgi:hypothetical protein|uniref:DUF1515 domain-containing protein n=1 Tax=Shinella sp. CPCC 101442 TaxID=2932265 RepID=UPI00215252B0|nr:DUF1515 domain-containing protein [Shinella sp. CPCC 101442]MCR6502613.1 DUF1515 domain-containing protein [Shinella sp. CPCC 101442]
MSPPEIDAGVHRQLGELVAGMHGLQDSIRRMEEAARRSEDKSEASRAVVHRRLDEVVDRVGKVETSIVTVQEDVTEMKPVTDEVRRWKLMGMGALGVTGLAAMALGVTFSEALKRIGMVLIGKG